MSRYWETIENERARGVNAALLISAALRDMQDALDTLAPHLGRKETK